MNSTQFFKSLCFITIFQITAQEIQQPHTATGAHNRWGKFSQKYAASLAPSILLGTVCGAACHFTDHYVFWPLDWFIWGEIRSSSADSIKKSLDEYGIEYDKNLFDTAAFASAWISYLASCDSTGKCIIEFRR